MPNPARSMAHPDSAPRKNSTPLDPAVARLFRTPTARYRGAPFWGWNSQLHSGQLKRQIEVFREMGFGGFHLHSRTGLATPYLGREFMERVGECVDTAREHAMLAWLYDEDRWPAGYAGGWVTADASLRLKYLLFTRTPYSGIVRPTPNESNAAAGRLENGALLARYAIRVADGALAHYRRLDAGEAPGAAEGSVWYAYLETADAVPWFNHQGYVDTLSPRAARRFIEVTHERYRAAVGREFGTTIPAIFCDEPQHVAKGCFKHAEDGGDVTIPATDDFFHTFRERYRADLLDTLPEVFWELPGGGASIARYRYHDHAAERFADAFPRMLGRWCQRHGLCLTGHMMEEPTLRSQTRQVGEVMRSLAHFQLPGIDMLCDEFELTTAKQAQSIARQFGRRGVMSELYGVTGWGYDFVGHKAQGDWQAACGVTERVPHLAWLSMAGEAKRDYPASIHYQSPWWAEYRLIEDHFARVNVLMTQGRSVARIGVIHPIESFWLSFGPLAETQAARSAQERRFAEICEWLTGDLLDFDFISEAVLATLPEQPAKSRFRVGRMNYEVVIVPGLRTLRKTTLERLERFVRAGGKVVFAGSVPSLLDAAPSASPASLAKKAERCEWDRGDLLPRLDPFRDVDLKDADGARYRQVLYQLRSAGAARHLFVCHLNRTEALSVATLELRGAWRVFGHNTGTGGCGELPVVTRDGRTRLHVDLSAHGHLLLTLRPGHSRAERHRPSSPWRRVADLPDPVPVSLEEPNVLLLDQAEWQWDGGPWQPKDEILRIHNEVRRRCGWPPREGNVAQPWAETAADPEAGVLRLRFRLTVDHPIDEPLLALEDPGRWELELDGVRSEGEVIGHWVDEAIARVKLPPLSRGEHVLVASRGLHRTSNVEWFYLLGDFSVNLAGRHARIGRPVTSLAFGDWTSQGLPFYTGNLTYHCRASLPTEGGADLALRFPHFSAPLLRCSEQDGRSAPVAFSPFRYELAPGARGEVSVDVTVYGNRHNAFGPLHNHRRDLKWIGPDAWRTSGEQWAYEYKLRPMGLLAAPWLECR